MYTNNIAGASVAYAIGLASAEFAKSLTLKAVIPFLQRVLEYLGLHAVLGSVSQYDFQDVGTMALYWMCMIGVSYFISEYIFSRCILGTATILTTDEKKTLKKAQEAVRNEPGPLQAVQSTVNSLTKTSERKHSVPLFDSSL
jgi:hypothetical protein